MRKVMVILLTFILIFSLTLTSFAKNEKKERINDIIEYHPEGDPDAQLVFIDEDLANGPSMRGVITEEYDYSYYLVGTRSLRSMDVGPITDQEFLESVARGSTKTLGSDIVASGSVGYTTSVTAEFKRLINLSFTATVSGSFSKTWHKGLVYVGPPEGSQYNSRNYYGAIQFDLYDIKVDRYDVYNVYDNGIFVGTETYNGTPKYVNGVKRPKAIEWSVDVTY